jgi:hypothetical protein
VNKGIKDSAEASLASRAAANISDGIFQGNVVVITLDEFMRIAEIAGSPLDFMRLPIDTKLVGSFSIAARILNTLVDIASASAASNLLRADGINALLNGINKLMLL